ncbi:GNAT family protein [Paracoccus onubensis]|uniref:GNAT family N-acetyltransferase n=1 Tax=Paracoccus onubensis TaxID=1675788 RepID=UPI0027320003|nr:GNAT family protein [Paracoccus onubensis]MDP0928503.1 GNAT family protein [Paracoccus onubensis]
MNKTTYVTVNQKDHLKAALRLTGSKGFMEDARAVAAYAPGAEGEADSMKAVAVFECFRGGRAELHLGCTPGNQLTLEFIQALVLMAFHPKTFNLDRVMARIPFWNATAQIAALKVGFQFEYRDRYSVIGGEDGIVMSLDRSSIIEQQATAGPHADENPDLVSDE